MYKKFFKRFFDIIMAFIALIVFAIPMIIFSIIIKCTSKGTVFFRQTRVGKCKKPFEIIKFRSMSSDTPKDVPTHLLSSAKSFITPVGAFMRKYSIDELPQIFNVLGGSMSIVGPRPALYNQYDLIEERDKYLANDVKPGITGLAQISGRDELPIDVKSKFDGEYVKKISFYFDIKCIFRTVFKVVKKEGVKEGRNEGFL
ncbi:MAG: sugar transferase [Clostridia bacterium]